MASTPWSNDPGDGVDRSSYAEMVADIRPLTVEEQKALAVATRRRRRRKPLLTYEQAEHAAERARQIGTEATAEELYVSLTTLYRALRRHGFKAPGRRRRAGTMGVST